MCHIYNNYFEKFYRKDVINFLNYSSNKKKKISVLSFYVIEKGSIHILIKLENAEINPLFTFI